MAESFTMSEPLFISGNVTTTIQTVGLLMRLVDVPEESAAVEWDKLKEICIKQIEDNIGSRPYENLVEVSLMPCGSQFLIKTPDDFRNLPIKDIPCSCGDPTHWFVKFERVDD